MADDDGIIGTEMRQDSARLMIHWLQCYRNDAKWMVNGRTKDRRGSAYVCSEG